MASVPPVVLKKKTLSYKYDDKSFKYLIDFIIATTKVCECLLKKKSI